MKIEAGTVIYVCMMLLFLPLLLVAAFRKDNGPRAHRPTDRQRELQMYRAESGYTKVRDYSPPPRQPGLPEPYDHETEETRRWVAAGLRKLGYTTVEAKRIAEMVPAGMDLQTGLQWALRNKGKQL